MKPARHIKHTDLFIIRVWTQDSEEPGNLSISWRGKIQRVVDGESREFRDWQALVDTLRSMISSSLPEEPHRSTNIEGDPND